MSFTFSSDNGGVDTLSVPGGWEIMYDGGITEANPEIGPVATVKFKVKDANDRYSFVKQLLGQWTGKAPSNITYVGPYRYPPSPNLLCTSVPSIESLGKWLPMSGVGLPWLFGQSATVTAVFTRPPWQAATNQGYFSLSFSGAGEYLTVPETHLQFADGTPTTTPVGIRMAQAQITVTRYRVPFIPDAVATPLLGTVNNAPFAIGWNTYDAGNLLFAAMASEVQPDPFGNITYQVQYIFQYRSVKWNYCLHPDRTTGFAPVTDGNSNPPYASTNFDLLP